MKKELFQDAFIKAERQSGNLTKHGLSNHLGRVLTEELKFAVSKITFVRYYEKYIEDDGSITCNPNSDLLNKLSEYLNYKNYEAYVLQHGKEFKNYNVLKNLNKESALNVFFIKHKITFIVCGFLFAGFLIFPSVTKQRWMAWEGNRYVEVKFNPDMYYMGDLKLHSESRIESFRKVVPDCETVFFDAQGKELIWYGANDKNELEYFTAHGHHPETGKALKPITKAIIKAHICDSY